MSLKAFHILFITISSALAVGVGVWALKNYFSGERAVSDLALGVGSLVAGVALIIYGKYFLKKLKDIGYL